MDAALRVVWDGCATDPIAIGTIIDQAGNTYTVRRESRSSWVPCHNGPFFTGRTEYFVGNTSYSTFQAALEALGLAS